MFHADRQASPGSTQLIVGVYFTALYRALASSRTRLLDHIQRRATVGRADRLDETDSCFSQFFERA
jgi:hypothetical protein